MASKRQVRKAVKAIKKTSPTALFLVVVLIALAIGGYYVYTNYFKKDGPIVDAKGELSFHFMMLGNENAGDCVYIKAGDNDILIDGGSRANSLDDIQNYLDDYVTDNTLEYVIVTHSDQDHIACFSASESIFDVYKCEVIIDFPLTNKSLTTASGGQSLYAKYLANRDEEVKTDGAKHFSALESYNESKEGAQREYSLTEDGNVKMEILYNYFYDHKASDENDYSVCVMFYHGDRQFLFTGDLEEKGEEYLAEKYDFTKVELFKAGHHGSPTSSTDTLLKEIQPEICVVCCCAGSVEYSDYLPNTFPSKEFYDRMSVYTSRIYAPMTVNIVVNAENPTTTYKGMTITNYNNGKELKPLHGNIVVISKGGEKVYVECSAEQKVLKDTEWFKWMSSMWVNSPVAD